MKKLEDVGPLNMLLILMVLAFLTVSSILCIGSRIILPIQLAKIESLRRDIRNVDPQQSQYVAGQVARWNQDIAAYQQRNALWWHDIFVPDEWNDVEYLPMPFTK